jgi:hypothetical protein
MKVPSSTEFTMHAERLNSSLSTRAVSPTRRRCNPVPRGPHQQRPRQRRVQAPQLFERQGGRRHLWTRRVWLHSSYQLCCPKIEGRRQLEVWNTIPFEYQQITLESLSNYIRIRLSMGEGLTTTILLAEPRSTVLTKALSLEGSSSRQ